MIHTNQSFVLFSSTANYKNPLEIPHLLDNTTPLPQNISCNSAFNNTHNLPFQVEFYTTLLQAEQFLE